jgi:hypothetical protein
MSSMAVNTVLRSHILGITVGRLHRLHSRLVVTVDDDVCLCAEQQTSESNTSHQLLGHGCWVMVAPTQAKHAKHAAAHGLPLQHVCVYEAMHCSLQRFLGKVLGPRSSRPTRCGLTVVLCGRLVVVWCTNIALACAGCSAEKPSVFYDAAGSV